MASLPRALPVIALPAPHPHEASVGRGFEPQGPAIGADQPPGFLDRAGLHHVVDEPDAHLCRLGLVERQFGLDTQVLPGKQGQTFTLHSSIGSSGQGRQPEAGEDAAFNPAQDTVAEVTRAAPTARRMPGHRLHALDLRQYGRQPGQRADDRRHRVPAGKVRSQAYSHGVHPGGGGIGGERIAMNTGRRLRRRARSQADQIEREAVGQQLQPDPAGGIGRIFTGRAIQRGIETDSEPSLALGEISNRRQVGSASRRE